jgi:putative inorganic carbon (HCO3(-)) transporter
MKFVAYCNKIIEYSFYGIFFFVPLLFSQYTSELFELNKIWTLYGFSILIFGAWATKMVLEKEFRIQKSILDIPLFLFLLSQVISTIVSIEPHISFYGYYSRFNGGLLSTIVFIFLYYAFISNLRLQELWRGLLVTIITGTIVALWGLPAHFGNDPTCLLFRGTFDTSCWTDAFHPTVRIFSTLGQPAWLAAYLAFLIPIAIFYVLKNEKNTADHKARTSRFVTYATIAALFYADLIFANTRAGYIGFLFAYITFWALVWFWDIPKQKKLLLIAAYCMANIALLFVTIKSAYLSMHVIVAIFLIALFILKKQYSKTFLTMNITFIIIAIIFGTPLGRLEEPVTKFLASKEPQQVQNTAPTQQPAAGTVLETNITDSGTIRKIVWQGAFDIWKSRPLFGTGVETYAFAYYQFRPEAHNLTSEWDYLYNKAHNEYLNYLATTGAFGLLLYMLIIGLTAFIVGKMLYAYYFKTKKEQAEDTLPTINYLAAAAISSGYISILISNFFGFSVVIINLYFFLTPAFLLLLLGGLPKKYYLVSFAKTKNDSINAFQWTYISVIVVIVLWLLLTLFRTWNADKAYALGYNLNRIGDFQNAYAKLNEAVRLRSAEPIFLDEYAITNATIASALYEQKDATNAAQFANQATMITDDLTKHHPNNVIFWKNRFKVYYLLASAPSDNQIAYRTQAIASLEKALELAPTDAKLMYNLGILYRDNGDIDKAIQMFEKAVKVKSDYRDAYYALGLLYRQKAVTQNGSIQDPAMQAKAVSTMQLIIDTFGKDSGDAKKSLQEWNVLGTSDGAKTP